MFQQLCTGNSAIGFVGTLCGCVCWGPLPPWPWGMGEVPSPTPMQSNCPHGLGGWPPVHPLPPEGRHRMQGRHHPCKATTPKAPTTPGRAALAFRREAPDARGGGCFACHTHAKQLPLSLCPQGPCTSSCEATAPLWVTA